MLQRQYSFVVNKKTKKLKHGNININTTYDVKIDKTIFACKGISEFT